jgi:hypothetical protein
MSYFFSYVIAGASYVGWNSIDVRFALDNKLRWILIVLGHWNNSPILSDTLFWFRANQSLPFLLNDKGNNKITEFRAILQRESQNS